MIGILLGLGAALSWAIAPSLYAIAMRDTSPLLALAIRTMAGGLFSLIIAILWEDFLGQLPFDLYQVVFIISINCLSMGLGDWCYFRSLKKAEVSLVVGISNIYPLFVAFFAILFGTEKITFLTLLATLIIVSGVILISSTKKLKDSYHKRNPTNTLDKEYKNYIEAILLSILAAFTWAITIYGLGFSLRYFSPFSANAIRITSVGFLLLFSHQISQRKQKTEYPSPFSTTLLVVAGVFALGVGSWMMVVSINLLGTARSSALVSLSPFFTALIAILILREKPTKSRIGGILLVCLGVILLSIE